MEIEGLISDLAFILILGALVTVLFKWIKQPVVLGYIVAGFLASPNFEYLPSVTTESNIEFWAQIGIVVLLFSLGLEFSFKKLLNAGGSAVVTALIIVTGMMITGIAIGHVLGFGHIDSIFLGGMLSMSSTTIIIKAFNDLGLRQRKFASLVLAVLIVEDLFAVLMMVLLSSIAVDSNVDGGQMLMSVLKLVFFLVIWFLVGVYVLPSALNATRSYLSDETLLVVAMGLCLGMAVFSVSCGFSLALGAFVMGSILAGTTYAERIEHVVTPVKDLFGAVFFISVGMMVQPSVIAEYWSPIIILSCVVIVGMILFGSLGMLLTGQTLRVAIESGFSLTQIGEFAFIIASLGMSLGVLDASIYPIVVAVSVITTFTTPYFIRMSDPAARYLEAHLPKKLSFLINRYQSNAAAESETKLLWRTVLKRYAWRVLLYSIILTAIVLISLNFILPKAMALMPHWGRLACCAVSLTAMAPFLLALSYPASRRTERHRLTEANARFDVPLIVMTLFRLLIALGFVVYLISTVYSAAVGSTVGISIFMLILMFMSKRVHRRLNHLETKFLNNLNQRELWRSGRNNNLVSDMHLAYMRVGYGCPFVGEKLQNTKLRQDFGVNVVNIQRGEEFKPVPGGTERIFPGDILGVIGTDNQIQEVLPVIEATLQTADNTPGRQMQFGHIQLTANSPLIDKTLAQADVRKVWHALVVAVKRQETFMPLDGALRFTEGDNVWLVADPSVLEQLK